MSEKSDCEIVVRVMYYYINSVKSAVSAELIVRVLKKKSREIGRVICVEMPRIPAWEWVERTVGEKNNREKSSATSAWNLLIREVKLIANNQAIILRRLDAYVERLRNLEQEMYIISNAANNGVEEIEGVKKARRVREIKMLKTFDMGSLISFMRE